MTEDEMDRSTAGWQRPLSTALITLGVLAWLPYFYLLIRGKSPSLFPFLGVHLAGVLPGAWLRSRARATPDRETAKGGRRRLAARILIVLGVLVWVPYFYLTRVAGVDQDIEPFLAVHLTGVLGGAALRISVEVDRARK